ncbi:MAG: CPBP family intramembrane glutamic endopeptidase [candidate division KSB1 bacterium]|nr:CPBP family intramembrane glutamic endopeptidase [candidate division KSB1 bacterium]
MIVTLPLLLIYEILALLMMRQGEAPLRNGVDMWLRHLASRFGSQPDSEHWFKWLFNLVGSQGIFVLSLLMFILVIAASYSFFRHRPVFSFKYCILIVLESGVYVWVLALAARFFATALATYLAIGSETHAVIIMSLGAGVFEELLFRAVGYGLVAALIIKSLDAKRKWPVKLMVLLASSLIFAWAHDLASLDFTNYTFLYRAVMGVLFCALYEFRGLGVAVWSHALYDLIVLMAGAN